MKVLGDEKEDKGKKVGVGRRGLGTSGLF